MDQQWSRVCIPGHGLGLEFRGGAEGENLTHLTHTHTHPHQCIACNLDSDAFKKLNEATKEVMGESKPYSITGSLPLVGDLQEPCTGEFIGCRGLQVVATSIMVTYYIHSDLRTCVLHIPN